MGTTTAAEVCDERPALTGNPERAKRGTAPLVMVAGSFALFYGYVLLRVHTELLYHLNPLLFLCDSDFFASFLSRPGGLVDYASAFLSPLFVWNWLGALVLTLLALFICLATRRYFAVIGGTGGAILFLVPAPLILMVLGQYSDLLRLCVGLLVALVFVDTYLLLGQHTVGIRLAAFVVASALVYYLAAGAFVIFACLCAIYEMGFKRHYWLGGLAVLSTLLVPWGAGVRLFDLSVPEAYRGLLDPFERHWLAAASSVPTALAIRVALLAFFPCASIAVAWCRWRTDRLASNPVASLLQEPLRCPALVPDAGEGARRVGERNQMQALRASRLPLLAGPLICVTLVAAGDLLLFDLSKQRLLQMDYGAEQRRWDEVLWAVRGIPFSHPNATDIRTSCQINRALYFTGGLLDRMFAYPQTMNASTLVLVRPRAEIMAQTTPEQASDILFDLGRINESEHMAYEALELFGHRPELLQRLVYVHALKGEPDVARKYLAVLERSFWHRRWAAECRRQLDADPLLSGVPEVASRRELMVARDSVNEVEHLESLLQESLARNRHNRMAFEYLMAHYLLTGQLNKLAANLRRLDDFDYPRLPRYLEEALVIHLEATRSPEPDLGKRKIRPETRRRAKEFLRILEQHGGKTPDAFAALYRDFGDSYFFCYLFGNNFEPPKPAGPPK